MIDLHCHVLPGIDDGPRTIEESVALARAASEDGTKTIVATPHVSSRYPNTAKEIHEAVAETEEELRARGIAVEVRAGAELAMTRVAELDASELEGMTLGGGRWLLLEPPFLPVVAGLDSIVAQLEAAGYRIVLAHPERCPAFHRDPDFLRSLIEGGALASITAGSLSGRFGKQVRRFATEMLGKGLVHNVASDAHDTQRRPPGIAGQLRQAGAGVQLSAWLTQAVPEAILSGAEIPPRPLSAEKPPARRWWWLRRA